MNKYVQTIIANGEARKRLAKYPQLNALKTVKPDITDPALIILMGVGEHFKSIVTDTLACFCIEMTAPAVGGEASDLIELVSYLIRGGEYEC